MHLFADHQAARPSATRRRWSIWSPQNPPIADWRGLRVWVIGASSGIGEALARSLAGQHARVLASARSEDALQRLVSQGQGQITAWPMDVTDEHTTVQVCRAILSHGAPDLVLYCAGHYRPMRAQALDVEELQRHLDINYRGALTVLTEVLPAMLARGSGHISLVSSVAGYRGLPQSLAYGPTKAALTNLAETLYLDLHDHGLGVSVVHPGFVKTPLTAQNDFAMPALISPEEAAQAMIDGWCAGRFDIHFPRRFTHVMKGLRLLPYRAYFALVRRFTGL